MLGICAFSCRYLFCCAHISDRTESFILIFHELNCIYERIVHAKPILQRIIAGDLHFPDIVRVCWRFWLAYWVGWLNVEKMFVVIKMLKDIFHHFEPQHSILKLEWTVWLCNFPNQNRNYWIDWLEFGTYVIATWLSRLYARNDNFHSDIGWGNAFIRFYRIAIVGIYWLFT